VDGLTRWWPVTQVGEGVGFVGAAKAGRQAIVRASKLPDLSLADRCILDAVLYFTVFYSKLTDYVGGSEIARVSNVSTRTVRRSLRRLAEGAVIVYVPGGGRGRKTVVGVPPANVKADIYLSSLGLPSLADIDGGKGDKKPGFVLEKGGHPARACVDREVNLRGEIRLSEEEPSEVRGFALGVAGARARDDREAGLEEKRDHAAAAQQADADAEAIAEEVFDGHLLDDGRRGASTAGRRAPDRVTPA
jgi:hypothetical protein